MRYQQISVWKCGIYKRNLYIKYPIPNLKDPIPELRLIIDFLP